MCNVNSTLHIQLSYSGANFEVLLMDKSNTNPNHDPSFLKGQQSRIFNKLNIC